MLSARYSRSKLLMYTALSIGFVLIGLWILRDPDPSGKALFSAWVGIVFFGPVAFVLARRLSHEGEVLRVDRYGVFDRRAMDRPVPWGSIRGITERRVRHNVIFNLHLTRPLEDFIDSRARRAFMSLNGLLGWGRDTIAINANALTVSTDQLRAAITAHYPIGNLARAS